MPFSSFSGWPGSFLDNSGVQVDVVETDKEVKVSAELPGVEEADIDVRVSDGMLVISGEKKADREVDENGYILHERSFGRVERMVPLPDGIDSNAAQASFKSGVLTVTIPKTARHRARKANPRAVPLMGQADDPPGLGCPDDPPPTECGAVPMAPHYFSSYHGRSREQGMAIDERVATRDGADQGTDFTGI